MCSAILFILGMHRASLGGQVVCGPLIKMGSDHHELIQILCKLDEMVCLRSGKCYAYFTKSTTSHHLHRHHPSPCPHHRSPPSLQWPPDSLLVSPPAPQPILNTQSEFSSVSSVTQAWPTLRHHGLQHARLPCPSSTPGACSNSCPSSY